INCFCRLLFARLVKANTKMPEVAMSRR
ncbi:hypothetical protein D030_2208B, partial [Vibrio parahaemolyticus AQ3810]